MARYEGLLRSTLNFLKGQMDTCRKKTEQVAGQMGGGFCALGTLKANLITVYCIEAGRLETALLDLET